MFRRNLFFLLIMLTSVSLVAQEDKVKEIRDWYASVQEEIKVSIEGELGGLYCNELVINKQGGSWRAVGFYLKTVKFWYSDDPRHYEAEEQLTVLRKIEVATEWSAGNKEYREYLFKDGKLIFAFIKDASYDFMDKPFETRWYYSAGKVIRYMEGQQILSNIPSDESLKQNTKELSELFLKSF